MPPRPLSRFVVPIDRGRCECGKVRWLHRADAKAIERKSRKKHGRQRPYLCGLCGDWHIGHNPDWLVKGERND